MVILNNLQKIKKFPSLAEELEKVSPKVKRILKKVRKEKDKAIIFYTRRFDGCFFSSPQDFIVTPQEIEEAKREVSPEFLSLIKRIREKVLSFHRHEAKSDWEERIGELRRGQTFRPLHRVGVYIPGGGASYPSSVLMNVIPAKLAGVKEICIVTPPSPQGKVSPHTLVTAQELGIEEIYKIGGAQAIGALTFGTSFLRPVDKIVGPGNLYVTEAKRQVYGWVGVDLLAGPSEILVVAGEEANPSWVALDLLSQAEHDPYARSLCISLSKSLAEEINRKVELFLREISSRDTTKKVLRSGYIFVVETEDEAAKLVNQIAPEHLEVWLKTPEEFLKKIENAGCVFLGPYSPVPVGDYLAGPSHTLPTGGTSRFFSGLGVEDFLKKVNWIFASRKWLLEVKKEILLLARIEGLPLHARAVEIRFLEKT